MPTDAAAPSALPVWLVVVGLCSLGAAVLGLAVASRARRLQGQGLRLWLPAILAALAGLGYGLAMRFGWTTNGAWLMTLGFIGGVPFAMGAISVFILRAAPKRRPDEPGTSLQPPPEQPSWAVAVLLPWAPVSFAVATTLLSGEEGLICVLMGMPLMLGSASLGGILAFVVRGASRKALGVAAIGTALLPAGVARLEEGTETPRETRTAACSIDIDAPAQRVWDEIKRVRAIEPGELPRRLSHLIGFPRPVEATLSFEGAGAVRKASFERGLVFTETVTTWKPLEELSFSIAVDPVPPEALDEHVAIGGPHFDVLDGTYRIEPLAAGGVRLHLSSRQRLSTRFNAYSGWWSDLVMSDIQDAILAVVKARAEAR